MKILTAVWYCMGIVAIGLTGSNVMEALGIHGWAHAVWGFGLGAVAQQLYRTNSK